MKVHPVLLNRFLGLVDLKIGCIVVLLYTILQKFGGVYGLLSILLNGLANVPLAQATFYVYSIITMVLLMFWGHEYIAQENAKMTLVTAHGLAIDHLITSLYSLAFGMQWRNKLRQHALAPSINSEVKFSVFVLVLFWLVKVYFIAAVYSYALHLQRGTYFHVANKITQSNSQNFNNRRPRRTMRHFSLDTQQDILWEVENEEEELDLETPIERDNASGRNQSMLRGL